MPSDVPFRQVRRMLERAGWTLARVRGSHHLFDRAGGPLVSIPVHKGQVKAFYAKQVEKLCGPPAAKPEPGDAGEETSGEGRDNG